MSNFRFAFVSNSAEIGEAVRLCTDPHSEQLLLRLATMEEAVPVAKRLLAEGVDVILGGGGTGSLLAQTIGQPVVKIARTHLDILRALIKAKTFGPDIGLTNFTKPIDGVEIFGNLLGVRIRQIVFSTTAELVDGISKALSEGVKCIVGGGICKSIVTPLGGQGVVVIPDKNDIMQALQEARAIATARRKEMQDVEQIRTIVETIKEGVIAIDNDGKVKVFNQMAADIFAVGRHDHERRSAIGQPLQDLLQGTGMLEVLRSGRPELDHVRRVGSTDIVINSLPVKVVGETQGVVATFKEAAKIQNIDRKVREKLYSKGFTARYTLAHVHGQSLKIRQLIDKAKKYAVTEASLLLEGETGSGKEVLAQAIHNLSSRRNKPFVAVNCAALPESLLESELFGYEEGAFTGAKKGGKIGLFELANWGTLYLDEINDIPPSLQVRLLRVLEEKEIMRVGGDKIVPVDVRIISSSYKNLFEEVKAGRFRMDLYFRLSTLSLGIPPLRERVEDIPDLVHELLSRYTNGKERISASMCERFKNYWWPGNVRELDSLVHRYVVLLGDSEFDDNLLAELLEELNYRYKASVDSAPEIPSIDLNGASLKDLLEQHEKAIIRETLKQCHLNKKETAKRLGISVNTLWRKMN